MKTAEEILTEWQIESFSYTNISDHDWEQLHVLVQKGLDDAHKQGMRDAAKIVERLEFPMQHGEVFEDAPVISGGAKAILAACENKKL